MYEYLDHTADAGIRATGPDLAAALTEAARGMLRLQVPPDAARELVETVEIVVESEDESELLLDWLGRLLAEQDLRGLLFTDAVVESIERGDGTLRLRGVAHGTPPDRLVGRIESEVKAVTAYGLRVEHGPDGVEVRVVVDL